MGFYDRVVFPGLMHWTLARREVAEYRSWTLPRGELLFLEHGKAPDAGVARRQDWLTPLWKRLAGGCHLNRPINEVARERGFTLMDTESGYLEGPRFLSYCSWGRAAR